MSASNSNDTESSLNPKRRPNGIAWQTINFSINPTILMLYYVNKLRRAVYMLTDPKDDFLSKLQEVFYELQFGETDVAAEPWLFPFESDESNDIQEYFCAFVDNFKTAMNNKHRDSIVQSLMEGQMLSSIRCMGVNDEYSLEETFYDLRLGVSGQKSIYKALDDYFKTEVLDGRNLYVTKDYGMQSAVRSFHVLKFPPVMCFQLLRSGFDMTKMECFKNNDRFEFPEELCLNKYVNQEIGQKDDYAYVLQSVVAHTGGAMNGYYTLFVNTGMERGQDDWYRFDVTDTKKCTAKQAIEDNYGGTPSKQSAIMLMYIQKSKMDDLLRPICKNDVPVEVRQELDPLLD